MGRWLLVMFGVLACDPSVEPSEDVGTGDGQAADLCPARILPSEACGIAGLTCPGSGELSCQCRGGEWRCTSGDAG